LRARIVAALGNHVPHLADVADVLARVCVEPLSIAGGVLGCALALFPKQKANSKENAIEDKRIIFV
jgi:hypothetical protein